MTLKVVIPRPVGSRDGAGRIRRPNKIGPGTSPAGAGVKAASSGVSTPGRRPELISGAEAGGRPASTASTSFPVCSPVVQRGKSTLTVRTHSEEGIIGLLLVRASSASGPGTLALGASAGICTLFLVRAGKG